MTKTVFEVAVVRDATQNAIEQTEATYQAATMNRTDGSESVIPGLTRNPEVHHVIPAFAGMTWMSICSCVPDDYLTIADPEGFAQTLLSPAPPSPALERAFARHRQLIKAQ